MPGITGYVLRGGPCDGKKGRLTPQIIQAGQLTCSSHIYKITSPVQVSGGREVFKDAGPVPKPPPTIVGPKAHNGWHHLRRTMNKDWNPAVQQSRRNIRAALRAVSHGHKVR